MSYVDSTQLESDSLSSWSATCQLLTPPPIQLRIMLPSTHLSNLISCQQRRSSSILTAPDIHHALPDRALPDNGTSAYTVPWFFNFSSFLSFFKARYYVALDSLKLSMWWPWISDPPASLFQALKLCQVPLCLGYAVLGVEPRAFRHARDWATNGATCPALLFPVNYCSLSKPGKVRFSSGSARSSVSAYFLLGYLAN